MDCSDICGPILNEPKNIVKKEESKLRDKLLPQDCKVAFTENISVGQTLPDESSFISGPLQLIKRKKSFNRKKPVKRRSTKTENREEDRISDKDIPTRSNSEEGEDTLNAIITQSSNLLSNSFLERVLNEKKMALLSSPEVIQFLQTQMRKKNKQSNKQEL